MFQLCVFEILLLLRLGAAWRARHPEKSAEVRRALAICIGALRRICIALSCTLALPAAAKCTQTLLATTSMHKKFKMALRGVCALPRTHHSCTPSGYTANARS